MFAQEDNETSMELVVCARTKTTHTINESSERKIEAGKNVPFAAAARQRLSRPLPNSNIPLNHPLHHPRDIHDGRGPEG